MLRSMHALQRATVTMETCAFQPQLRQNADLQYKRIQEQRLNKSLTTFSPHDSSYKQKHRVCLHTARAKRRSRYRHGEHR